MINNWARKSISCRCFSDPFRIKNDPFTISGFCKPRFHDDPDLISDRDRHIPVVTTSTPSLEHRNQAATQEAQLSDKISPMMNSTILRSGKYPPGKTGLLYVSLVGAGLIVYLPTAWVYLKVKMGLGVEVAQITLTFAMVICLGLVLVGMGLAYFMDRAILGQRFIFHAPRPGSWVEALIRTWGFELIGKQPENSATPATAATFAVDEALAILNKPRRKGRKPNYTIDQWMHVVLAWENRDTLRNTMTLVEMLGEIFGAHPDGSPRTTASSYYTWRKKVLIELKNESEALKSKDKKSRGGK
jgi:hypothetical protein